MKIALILVFDFLIALFTLYLSFATRLETFFPNIVYVKEVFPFIAVLPLIILVNSKVFSIHNVVLRTLNIQNIYSFFLYSGGISLLFIFINYLGNLSIFRSIPIIFFLYFFVSIILLRLIFIKIFEILKGKNIEKNIIIFGAGNSGLNLASSFNMSSNHNILGFIDDNLNLLNTKILNLNVFSRKEFKKKFQSLKIDEIWIAAPSATEKEKDDIISFANSFNIKVLSLPSFNEMILRGDRHNKLIEIKPEHFLGREDVSINSDFFDGLYYNKNILVTGAGGSIGSEICIQASKLKPKKIVLFELSEFNLYQIQEKFKQLDYCGEIELVYFLGSITNSAQLSRIIKDNDIEIVFHAAAYKHVNILEKNILEGFNNNVIGTHSVIKACIENNIERFVLVSTDKAVKPASYMGITKRISEMIVNSYAQSFSAINFSIVRFGNVIGSSGSVIPLFKQQILNGGPVTVTDTKMTRYFMSIPEAAKLILLAGSYGKKAEIFLLDMGEPIKIIDLAKSMINLYGYNIKDKNNKDGDIEIKITNINPGEKFFEQLQIGSEKDPTEHPKVFKLNNKAYDLNKIKTLVKEIEELIIANDVSSLEDIIKKDYILQND